MIKRLCDFLGGLPMTIVSGVFLLMDLAPHVSEEFTGRVWGELPLPFDPSWVTVVICGAPLLYLAVWRIVHNRGISKISSALLICIAMFAALAIGETFAAGEVVFIMALGALLEDATTGRAKKGLRQIAALAPTEARLVRDGVECMVPVAEVRPGDVVRVLPGERIPVDGAVVSGETSVDQSVMTGESLPVDKALGDEVFCGTVNRFGAVEVEVTRVGEDSSLETLVRMVEEAEGRQAPIQRIADRVASWLVPAVLLLAAATYVATGDRVVAVTLLVVFCPCALVLATPTAVMAAVAQATRRGVVVKSGEKLERMGRVDTVAFDKTGTLTKGELDVSDAVPLADRLSADGLLALAASVESRSEHPLGRAIVASARGRGLDVAETGSFSMEAGRGVRASVEGRELVCGSERHLREAGCRVGADAEAVLSRMRGEGKACVLLGEAGGACLGVIALSDVVRPEAAGAVARLRSMGVRTVLLTGDNRATAEAVASRVGIDEIRAGLLPDEKVSCVEALMAEGRVVCMVGDGVNDAPALKIADVGVAMGAMGSDIAVEAADVALMGDEVERVPYLKRLSNATIATIRASIALSMCINAVAVALSLAGLLTPVTGALWHNIGSCLVVIIAAALYDRKFE